MYDLGTLEMNGFSIANAINNKGQIVGSASAILSGAAVLWENGQIYNLNNLLFTETDWVLLDAKDINDQGCITGRMENNGQARAFLLTPVSAPSVFPIADAGNDQTVSAESDCLASVTLDGNGSFDPNGNPISYEWTWDGGLAMGADPNIQLSVGINTITLVVNNGIVDSQPDTVEITVVDDTPPKISMSVNPDTLWPPNHKMVSITPIIAATDNCDPNPQIRLVSITMNEGETTNTYDPAYDVTQGDGSTVGDIQVDASGNIALRAERSGTGTGRVYILTYEAEDQSGNIATATATVTVPHDMN
jgi:probable HAF family extracellular repeat protein